MGANNREHKDRPLQMLDLINFRYCANCGHKSLQPFESKGCVCALCGFQYFLNPGAVVSGIIELGDKIILTKRARDPQKGLWAFPGGFVEYGEGLEDALAREIHEELNLEVCSATYLCSGWETYLYQEVTYPLVVTFFVVRVRNEIQIEANDDVESYSLVSSNGISGYQFAFESNVIASTKYKYYLAGRSKGVRPH